MPRPGSQSCSTRPLRRTPHPPLDGSQRSYCESLPNSGEDLFPGNGLGTPGTEFVQSPLGDGCPFPVDFGVRGIERPEQRVNNNCSLLYRKRLRFAYDLGRAWHSLPPVQFAFSVAGMAFCFHSFISGRTPQIRVLRGYVQILCVCLLAPDSVHSLCHESTCCQYQSRRDGRDSCISGYARADPDPD